MLLLHYNSYSVVLIAISDHRGRQPHAVKDKDAARTRSFYADNERPIRSQMAFFNTFSAGSADPRGKRRRSSARHADPRGVAIVSTIAQWELSSRPGRFVLVERGVWFRVDLDFFISHFTMSDNSATDDEASDDSESSGNTAVDSSGSDIEDIVINPSWVNNTNGLRQIPFTGNNRLLVDVPGNGSPIDWFFMLMDDPFLLSLLRQETQPTNLYKMKNGIKRVTENPLALLDFLAALCATKLFPRADPADPRVNLSENKDDQGCTTTAYWTSSVLHQEPIKNLQRSLDEANLLATFKVPQIKYRSCDSRITAGEGNNSTMSDFDSLFGALMITKSRLLSEFIAPLKPLFTRPDIESYRRLKEKRSLGTRTHTKFETKYETTEKITGFSECLSSKETPPENGRCGYSPKNQRSSTNVNHRKSDVNSEQ
ncbi:hypothetical protein J6590_035174 [Homalodisca vitripennis]|nr:hypothetical protein J6590_035174 [Homalodisca vitripennis]